MVDAGYTWRAANSGYGNTENGTFFGTNSGSCTIANGNCIFLPARGYNGHYVGSYGYYWSSTPYNGNYYYLCFYNGSSHVYSSTSYNYNNYSVLCIQ